MGGTFSKDNRPVLPGVYFREEAVIPTTITPNAGAIVAIPFTHTWGPFKQATLLPSMAQFDATFGNDDSPGRRAVMQAFFGEGSDGRGGAGYVLAYRTGSSAALKATKVLQNTTPANAVTVSAKFEGTRGNNLRLTTQDTAGDSTKTDLIVLNGTAEVERYTFTDADLNTTSNSLAAQVTANSDWITVNVTIDGVVLAVVTAVALTGGNDGSTLITADWTNLMSALEVERFGVFAPYDLTDSTILASLVTWAKNLNAAGKRFQTVVGGALNESITTAVTRSGTINDGDFVNVGVGSISDWGVLGTTAAPITLSTSQLAPRVAGISAQRGEVDSLTYGRLYGVTILQGPTEADKLTALKGGVLVIGRDSNAAAPVRLEKAITTYTTTTNVQKPYVIYRSPKFVRTMHGIEMEFTEWMEGEIIGKTTVNNKTRDAAKAELGARLQRRVDAKIIQTNYTVDIDQDPPPSDDDEFVALVYGIKFGRSVEQVFNILRVG